MFIKYSPTRYRHIFCIKKRKSTSEKGILFSNFEIIFALIVLRQPTSVHEIMDNIDDVSLAEPLRLAWLSYEQDLSQSFEPQLFLLTKFSLIKVHVYNWKQHSFSSCFDIKSVNVVQM